MANFGDILSSITLGSHQSVRRTFDDTAFEAYNTDVQTVSVRVRSSDYAGGLPKGTVVYIAGSVGSHPYVLKADADSEMASSKTFGVLAEDIAANGDGLCATSGLLVGLDLKTSDGWADGDPVWLSSTAGLFTKTKPTSPAHLVFVGYVINAHPTLGSLMIHIVNGFEVDELHDVLITSVQNNDVLTWESSSSLWKNKPVSSGSKTLARFFADAEVYDSTETDIMSYTVPAGLMATNGDIIRGEYAGTCASAAVEDPNAGFGIYVGGLTFGAVSPGEVSTGDWNIRFTLIRVTSTSHRITTVASFNTMNGLKTVTDYGVSSGSIDWTGTEDIALALNASEFGSITAKMGYIEYVGQ